MLVETANSLTERDLLEILDVDKELANNDFRSVHRACQSLAASEAQLADGIIAGERYTEWLSSTAADALFIEGGEILTLKSRYTFLSLLSCVVIDGLQGKDPAITIQHFCGRHVNSHDALNGPKGMMRNLICQLVRHLDNQPGRTFCHSRRSRDQLENHGLQALCQCFKTIVSQLPVDTVLFCIIDGIHAFEKFAWAEDCRLVINELQDLVYEEETGPLFKLLITSPVRSKQLAPNINAQFRVRLSGQASASRDDPTERDIAVGAQIRQRRERDTVAFRSLSSRAVAALDVSSEELSDSDAPDDA